MASALYLENFLESKSEGRFLRLSPFFLPLSPFLFVAVVSRHREPTYGAAAELYSHAFPGPASSR